MREVQDGRIARPGGDFCERIGAGDEENLRTLRLASALRSFALDVADAELSIRAGPPRSSTSVSKVYDGP